MNQLNDLSGEYYLKGMMEMASAFVAQPDQTFQFYFTYGALDRYGSGTWAREGNQMVFNSVSPLQPPYRLVSSHRSEEDDVRISIVGEPAIFRRHTFCRLGNSADAEWIQMDESGEMIYQPQPVSSISLVLEFCSEKMATIPSPDPTHNTFVFEWSDDIMEVYFRDFALRIGDNMLTGMHPLLTGKECSFEKTR